MRLRQSGRILISRVHARFFTLNPMFPRSLRWCGLFLGLFGGAVGLRAGVGSWTLLNPLTSTDTYAIANGNGRWVVVGAGGLIAVSSDAENWAVSPSGTTTDLRAVTYGNGVFYAVGIDGSVLESSDASTWTAVRPPSGDGSVTPTGAAYGAGTCVIVESDGTILTSHNGGTWATQTLSSSGSYLRFLGVTYGGGQFVVVGEGGGFGVTIFTSSDGTTWTPQAADLNLNTSGFTGNMELNLNAVCYGGGRYIAVGDTDVVLISPDAIHWTPAIPTTRTGRTCTSVAYGNGTYVIGTDNSGLLTSPDGVNWTTEIPSGAAGGVRFTSLCFAGGRFVAGGLGGRLITRTADSPWVSVAPGPAVRPGGVAYGNGRYVVASIDSTAEISSDGRDWTITPQIAGFGFYRVAYGNGLFVSSRFSSSVQSEVACSSTDGLTWTQGSVVSGMRSVIFSRGKFFAPGWNLIADSSDGVNWTSTPTPNASYTSIADGNGRLVAVGASNNAAAVATSDDGVTWTAQPSPGPTPLNLVAFGNGRYFATSDNSMACWSSADGVTWTPVSLPAPTNSRQGINDLLFADGMFVMTSGSDLYWSTNGTDWSVEHGEFGQSFESQYYLTFGNGSFLAVGDGKIYRSSPDAGAIDITATSPDATVLSGNSETLSVTATGTGLTYQWYEGPTGDTSKPIPGATATTLTLSAVTTGGTYWVRVSNGSTFIDARATTLNIAVPPAFGTVLPDCEVAVGEEFTLVAPATGFPTPTVEWFEGEPGDVSHPVSGAASTGLTLVAGTTSRHFWARATNVAGTADSPGLRFTPWAYTPPVSVANVRWLDGTFVEIGGGLVRTSPDGKTWDQIGQIADADLQDVAKFGNEYVAVGNKGYFISPDLAHWTQINLPADSSQPTGATSLALGDGVLVAAGAPSTWSTDGVNWTPIDLPPWQSGSSERIRLESVAFNGSRFVAVGKTLNNGYRVIYTSADGQRWTSVGHDVLGDAGNSELVSVNWVGGKFIAVDPAGMVFVSTDGISWSQDQPLPLTFGRLKSATFFRGRYYVGTDFGGANVYFVSDDALTWRAVAGPEALRTPVWAGNATSLLAVGDDGTACRTDDGSAWSQFGGIPNATSVAYGKGRYIALGFMSSFTSEDGVAWRSLVPNLGTGRVVFGDGQFVVSADTSGQADLSTDGVHWARETVAGGANFTPAAAGSHVYFLTGQTAVAYGDGHYVMVGSGIQTSTDGNTWTTAASAPSGIYYAVAYGDGTFVAAGVIGSANTQMIAISSDGGASWTEVPAPAGIQDVTALGFIDGEFLAATDNGLAYSADGRTWESNPLISTQHTLVVGPGTALADLRWRRSPDGVGPEITSLPGSAEIPAGGSATLTVVAAGAGLTYQWYEGQSGDTSNPVAGAMGATFTTPALTGNGRYWVRVANAAGTVDSQDVLVVIAGPPTIVAQPFSGDVLRTSDSVTLHVVVESGVPVTYQWYEGKPGDTGVPIPDATGSRLVVTMLRTADYWVRVTNSHGSTDSTAARVSAWSSLDVSTSAHPFSSRSLAYGNGRYVMTGIAPGLSMAGGVQTSPDGNTWTESAAPELGDVCFGNGRFVACGLLPSNDLYECTDGISWNDVRIGSSPAELTSVQWVGGRFVALGASGTVATSTNGLTWATARPAAGALNGAAYGNGTYVIVGAGGATFRSTDGVTWAIGASGTSADLGSIAFDGTRFLAMASTGDLLSSPDGVQWTAAPVALADRWSALPAGSTLVYAGGRWLVPSPAWGVSAYSSSDGEHWWTTPLGTTDLVEDNQGIVGIQRTVETSGNGITARGSAPFYRMLAPDVVPVIATPPSAQIAVAGHDAVFSVAANSASPVTYQWRKDGMPIAGATGATLDLANVASGDAGSYDVVITNAGGSTTAPAVTLAVDPEVPTLAAAASLSGTVGVPISYQIDAHTSGVTYSATSLPAGLSLAAATGLITGTPTSTGTSTVTIGASNAVGSVMETLTVTINVSGNAGGGSPGSGAGGGGAGNVSAPVITSQPGSVATIEGGSGTFAVVASGTALSYQWAKDGKEIPGATQAALKLTGVKAADAGTYVVTVSNSAGSVTSAPASLVVNALARAYFGTFAGGAGSFAVLVRPDHTGVFLGYVAASRLPLVDENLTTDASGSFSVTIDEPAAPSAPTSTQTPPRMAAAAEYVVTGTVATDGSLAGTVSGLNLTFSAPTPALSGPAAALAGFYHAGVASSSAESLAIIGPGGGAYVLLEGSGTADAGLGTVGGKGSLAVATANNVQLSGAVSGSVLSFQATTAGAATVTYAGSDDDPRTPIERLFNISTRSNTEGGDNVLIGGFVVTGSDPKPVLIRAIGPTLSQYGVTGCLPSVHLVVYQNQTIEASSDDWGAATNASAIAAAADRVGAFPLPAGSHDAAVLVTLPPGSYTAVVTGRNGASGVALVEAYDATPGNIPLADRIVDLSSRAPAGSGDQTLIAGFYVTGSVPKRVLIRGVGPSLAQYGVNGALGAVQLKVYSGDTVLAQNSGWSTSPDAAAIATATSSVHAFPLPSGSQDAAVILNLAPGAYTAQVSGAGGATGVALVEVYEVP